MEIRGSQMEDDEHYCRICFNKTDYFYNLEYGTPTIFEKFTLCLPTTYFYEIENPVFCVKCYTLLTQFYMLIKDYEYNNNKIKEYLSEYSPSNCKNIIKEVAITKNSNNDSDHMQLIMSLQTDIENTKKFSHKFPSLMVVEDDLSLEGGIPVEEIIDSSADPALKSPHQETINLISPNIPQNKSLSFVESLETKTISDESMVLTKKNEVNKIQITNKYLLKKSKRGPNELPRCRITEARTEELLKNLKLRNKFISNTLKIETETNDTPGCDSTLDLFYDSSETCDIDFEADDLGELNDYKHTCKYCSKGFRKVYAFKRHLINIHYKNKDFKCKYCPKQFGTNYDLKRHEETHTNPAKLYQCKTCFKRFSNNSSLWRHELIHADVKKFKCDNCEKSFADVSTLRQHVRNVHKRIKNHVCSDCGNAFAKKDTLTKHMVIHTKMKQHSCTLCDKAYRDKSALSSHMKRRHPGNVAKETLIIENIKMEMIENEAEVVLF